MSNSRITSSWTRVGLGVLLTGLALGCHPPQVLDPLEPEDLEERECSLSPLFFEGNSFMLRSESLSRIKTMALCISGASRPVKLSGHSDRMGSRAYRDDIGRKRARAVKAEMVRLGVIPELITTTSYGSNRQVCNGAYKRCASLNRRVTIELQ